MALGVTIVEVIMKNISNKNTRSVIDDMLKVGDILFLRFKLTTNELKVINEKLKLMKLKTQTSKSCYALGMHLEVNACFNF